MEKKKIDLSKVRPGPIRHEDLPPELLDAIKSIYDVVGRYTGQTLEQWEVGFMRDMHPEREVAVWAIIAKAWQAYHEKYLNGEMLPDEEERSLLRAIIAISTGMTDVAELKVPHEVGHRLMGCYKELTRRR